jgi:hypothetical protein
MTDFHDPGVIQVKRGLRKIYDEHPVAFEWFVSVLQRSGELWRSQLPPMEKGKGDKPLQVNRELLALLLADYRNRKGTREQFLEDLAQDGCRYGNPYFLDEWKSGEAIANHLKRAEKIAKADPDFEAEVETWRECLGEIAPGQPTVTGI